VLWREIRITAGVEILYNGDCLEQTLFSLPLDKDNGFMTGTIFAHYARGRCRGDEGSMFRPSIFLFAIALAASLTVGVDISVEAAPLGGGPAPGLAGSPPPDQILLIFDDMGNGTIFVGGSMTGTSLPGTLMDDPADPACPSMCTPALTYLLPASEPVVTGDVAIFAPGGTVIADWLRFTDTAGDISGADSGPGGRMIFYFDPALFASNIGDGNAAPGPTQVITAGIATFDYQPAGMPYPYNNEYIGSQEVGPPPPGVPEPGSLALLGGGIIAMAAMIGRRRVNYATTR
jgi:hypothetical protein